MKKLDDVIIKYRSDPIELYKILLCKYSQDPLLYIDENVYIAIVEGISRANGVLLVPYMI